MNWRYLGLMLTLLANVHTASASVIINEVAWMGSLGSANHEWIELFNQGTDAAPLDGWTVTDGQNLTVLLSGTLPSGAYGVLERSTEDSSPVTALVLYTGALVNTGATLTLKDQTGVVIDQVQGGENWSVIGGDNSTKQTAQRTPSTWVTAEATPGSANVSMGSVPTVTSESSTPSTSGTTKKSSGGSSANTRSRETVDLNRLGTDLDIKIKVPSVAYVDQEVTLEAGVGFADTAQSLINYEWNFGDTFTQTGKSVTHTYHYPGVYVVTVQASYKGKTQVVRSDIEVLTVDLALGVSLNGDIQVHNQAAYDVDVSGYSVRGLESVVFPSRSVLLPGAQLTISGARLGLGVNSLVMLYDANNTPVTSVVKGQYLTQLQNPPPPLLITLSSPAVYLSREEQAVVPLRAELKTVSEPIESSTVLSRYDSAFIENQEEDAPDTKVQWPYLALIGLLGMVLSGMFLSRKELPSQTVGD
jgi:PKD repeat protein